MDPILSGDAAWSGAGFPLMTWRKHLLLQAKENGGQKTKVPVQPLNKVKGGVVDGLVLGSLSLVQFLKALLD